MKDDEAARRAAFAHPIAQVGARSPTDAVRLQAELEPYLAGALTADEMIQALGRKYRVIDAAIAAARRRSDATPSARQTPSPNNSWGKAGGGGQDRG